MIGKRIRSSDNRGSLTEERYHLLCSAVRGNPDCSNDVDEFTRTNLSYLYDNSCQTRPKFTFDEDSKTLYKMCGSEKRIVVSGQRAKAIVADLHRPSGGACRKDGVNMLVKRFSLTYHCKGIKDIVIDVKKTCNGTCQNMKVIKCKNPPPRLIRTHRVMERIQVDLFEMYGSQSKFKSMSIHEFRLVLVVKDGFSKYCWLLPLTSKHTLHVVTALHDIFIQFDSPEILQSDNGGEFTSNIIKELCNGLNVNIIHGQPYHPQTQGQVENLNGQVKSVLKHRLLDFPLEKQALVWPFLLPEVAFWLNSS